jgi:hypothetical protein
MNGSLTVRNISHSMGIMRIFPACLLAPVAALALFHLFVGACFASDKEEQQKQAGRKGEQSADRVPIKKNGKIARWEDMVEKCGKSTTT